MNDCIALIMGCALMVFGAKAHAERNVILRVADDSASETALIEESFQLALQDSGLRRLGDSTFNVESTKVAREHLTKGKEAYLQLELETAVSELESALQGFDVLTWVSPTELQASLSYLGASHVLNGNKREAERAFRRMQSLFPSASPDENVFSPDVIEAFVKAKVRRQSMCEITALGVENSHVFIDHDYKGTITTENVVVRVPDGEHKVIRVHPGYGIAAETLRCTRGVAETKLEQTLLHETGVLWGMDTPASEMKNALRGIDADEVVLVDVAQGAAGLKFDVTVFKKEGDDFKPWVQREREVAVSELLSAENIDGLSQTLLMVPERRVARPIEPTCEGESCNQETPSSGSSVLEEPWFWVVVGGVAVVGAAVAVGVAVNDGREKTGVVIVEF